MADDMTEAENLMAEKEQWGLTRSDTIIARLIRLVKAAGLRLKALEDRVSRLEGKP